MLKQAKSIRGIVLICTLLLGGCGYYFPKRLHWSTSSYLYADLAEPDKQVGT